MLKSIFTWWNGATIGARFDIGRRARAVGQDDQGNKYFEERKPSLEGRKRRYVIYNGYAEPSRVPAEWHGWLHHQVEDTPDQALEPVRAWQKPAKANVTGTRDAYRPSGSLDAGGVRAAATGDYEAWVP